MSKKYAVLGANSLIENVAVWDGVTPWAPANASKDLSNRIVLGIGKTYTEHPGSFNYNIVIDGNSIAWMYQNSSNCIENALIQCGYPYSDIYNVSSSGKMTYQLARSATVNVDSNYYTNYGNKNVCIIWEISNDIRFGQTPAQAYDNLKMYCQGRKTIGWKTLVATCLPRTGESVDMEAQRVQVNQWIRDAFAAREPWIDALADVGADPLLGNVATTNNVTYYYDKTHLTVLGHSLLVNCFKAAIQSLNI